MYKKEGERVAVAPSYQQYELSGDPFKEDKKWYVYIKAPKGLKKVRWYPKPEDYKINAHKFFGFGENNYINLIIGKREDIIEWKNRLPLYTIFDNTIFGWFMPSTNEVKDIPTNIKLHKLTWNEVKDDDIHIIPEKTQKYVGELRARIK